MSHYKPTLIGERFGKLTVTKSHIQGQRLVECLCDCGTTREVLPKLLRINRVRSCGCLRRDAAAIRRDPTSRTRNAQRAKLWRENNPEKFKAKKDAWHARNREKIRSRAKILRATPEYRQRYAKQRANWRARHPEILIAEKAVRRASEMRAVPAWSETKPIRQLYKQARLMSMSTGIKHDVDHIIPLRHKLVSGLHILANLQILSASRNRAKGNKFDPETVLS